MDRQNQTDAAARQQPGSRPAHGIGGRENRRENQRMAGGDRDHPGEQPDEIVPTTPDTDRPDRTPDEVQPGQGDFDRPDSAPEESPPQPGTAPRETPPPD